ncbi:hypothetical protein ACLIMP_09725 [Novosphingobium aerophilum]|uniref:hypothetical protein n=1 Tax=Novosphingobium TaxID=165696 RepID=UPI0006C89A8E|nr:MULTISPECIES: hypothetical protein [unclassified Novosphingobium]KPH58690.1 hypothetical protein ADT71_25475 [Novosphingobium sp. ST904]MPS70600.1 hypothetical protein [Novosphingobium sp.]TCM42164.1 hypothetical protein EDF59_102126 [Novosphingobium sp. ST904]WRT91433.1 hypothetical protein U9J33_09330 [Novosphingobium sp. RL4]
MRIDARNLLDRLGRNEFAYKEFEDRFTDLELWPILEALLRDPRLQTLDQTVPETPAVETAEAGIELAAEPLKNLFSRYEQTASPSIAKAVVEEPVRDVRAMLRHLSDLGARGEI